MVTCTARALRVNEHAPSLRSPSICGLSSLSLSGVFGLENKDGREASGKRQTSGLCEFSLLNKVDAVNAAAVKLHLCFSVW